MKTGIGLFSLSLLLLVTGCGQQEEGAPGTAPSEPAMQEEPGGAGGMAAPQQPEEEEKMQQQQAPATE